MNLFTRYLSQRLRNRRLLDFIAHWDAIEQLVIHTFKSKAVDDEARAEYIRLRRYFEQNYPAWRTQLEPLWQQTLVGGRLAAEDPFRRVVQAKVADDLIGDWGAMQNLAAAREALNKLLIELQR